MLGSESRPASSRSVQELCCQYRSLLAELKSGKKECITKLSIQAEKNMSFAGDIVSLVEMRIVKAPASEKLPGMYLMDSIVKNVGRDYLTAFAKNLVATFVGVFIKVDRSTRKKLFHLRCTWDGVFPSKTLYTLDVAVNSLDPAWPIKPLPPKQQESTAHTSTVTPGTSSPPALSEIQKDLTQEQLLRQQLLAKEKQLREIQHKILEVEQAEAELAASIGIQQGSFPLASVPPPSKQQTSSAPHMTVKPPHQTTVLSEKNKPSPSPPCHDIKIGNRDPPLNRMMSQHSSDAEDQSPSKAFPLNMTSQSDTKAKRTTQAEKRNSAKQEKLQASEKPEKNKLDQSEGKSKSPASLKNELPKSKETKPHDHDSRKVSELSKQDPRQRRHLQDKSEGKEEEVKERRSTEEEEKEEYKACEHRTMGSQNEVINGAVQKQGRTTEKLGEQARLTSRKWSRPYSPKAQSPSTPSLKEVERRSPERSLSPTSSAPKIGKLHQIGPKKFPVEEDTQAARDERNSDQRNVEQEMQNPRRAGKARHEDPEKAQSPGSRFGSVEGDSALVEDRPLRKRQRTSALMEDRPLLKRQRTSALMEDRPLFDSSPRQTAARIEREGQEGPFVDGPAAGSSFRMNGPSRQAAMRFEGPLMEAGASQFDGLKGPTGQPVSNPRFEGPGADLRLEAPCGPSLGPYGQPRGGLRFEQTHLQPLRPHSQPGGGLRFERPHDQPVHQVAGGPRFNGPLSWSGPRFGGCHATGFDGQPGQSSLLPGFDGIHGQPGPTFERVPHQQAQPRFDTDVPQRFDGPHQPPSRFDLFLGLQGTSSENIAKHLASRQEMSPYGQGGSLVEHSGQGYNRPSQRMQFQRHDLCDGMSGPNFHGPAGLEAQNFPWRASGHYSDEKILQSPQHGNFSNVPMGTNQVSLMSAEHGQGQENLLSPGTSAQNPAGALPHSSPDKHCGQLDVNELFAKLVSVGILKLSKTDSTSADLPSHLL